MMRFDDVAFQPPIACVHVTFQKIVIGLKPSLFLSLKMAVGVSNGSRYV